jgi:acetyl-CoA carboxylase carboxyl transferase subunit alpha
MSRSMPVICTVIGEGGSGGALAIGVGDKGEYAAVQHLFRYFSPEGCVHSVEKRRIKRLLAAEAMGDHCPRLKELVRNESIIPVPLVALS